MDERHLSAGEAAYAAGDWQHAALEFMAAAHGSPADGAGPALHHAGNALVKLGRYADAVTVYQKAVRDTTYPKRGAVFANLGAALAAVDRSEEALEAYGNALVDPDYATPYKALLGQAGALYALGRFEDAAQSFRQAAWADGNPDPGRALNNLGLSFMSLGRPEDAVEAFKAALGIEGYASKGKASANLGLAYAAMGFFEDAVLEFESARDEHSYELIGATLETYETARARVRTEGAGPDDDFVAGRDPGDNVAEDSDLPEDFLPPEGATSAAPVLPDADDEATRSFFTRTEDEMRKADRAVRKQERRRKRTPKRLILRIAIAVIVLLVIGGGLGAAFFLGYGYPTQEQTVTGLLSAYQTGSATYADFWVAAPAEDVTQSMRALPAAYTSFTIDGVDRASADSTVAVSVSLQSGATQSFLVMLQREGVGWKVVGIQNSWGSLTQ